jgi:hypothetical protein
VYSGVTQVRFEKVVLRSLDQLVIKEKMPKVDVMKIDVEGGEAAVLRGAQKVLHEQRPIVLMEMLEPALREQGSSKEEVWKVLESVAYEIYAFSPETGYPEPIDNSSQLSDNILAIPCELSLPAFFE